MALVWIRGRAPPRALVAAARSYVDAFRVRRLASGARVQPVAFQVLAPLFGRGGFLVSPHNSDLQHDKKYF